MQSGIGAGWAGRQWTATFEIGSTTRDERLRPKKDNGSGPADVCTARAPESLTSLRRTPAPPRFDSCDPARRLRL
eukprot:11156196-Lingulodinium_polyedra.AAC.1